MSGTSGTIIIGASGATLSRASSTLIIGASRAIVSCVSGIIIIGASGAIASRASGAIASRASGTINTLQGLDIKDRFGYKSTHIPREEPPMSLILELLAIFVRQGKYLSGHFRKKFNV
jgi:hypothetical protein